MDHLKLVAQFARQRAEKFGAAELGALAGYLHDFGKVDPKFQARLAGSTQPFDHAGPGAALAQAVYRHPLVRAVASLTIAGHHTGLMDTTRDGEGGANAITPLDERLRECAPRLPDQQEIWKAEGFSYPSPPATPVLVPREKGARAAGALAFTIAFFTRMVFSALVDADFIATESFYEEKERGFPDVGLAVLKARLDASLAARGERAWRSQPCAVNDARADVLAACRSASKGSQGVYTLAAPTGAGKTLASLAFALEHAVRHGLDRVIVVIPYTSVVEQTAQAYREALGRDDVVLEHHGSFDDAKLAFEAPEMSNKLLLSQENWDAPIVVTTAVQFFESLFHNKTSRCRKLHNIVRSVVILDEAQTLPIPVLRPIVLAIDELARNYRTTLVLSTATQPALLENAAAPAKSFPDGLRDVRPILRDEIRFFEILKRVEIDVEEGPVDDEALAERMARANQILTIVNTRRHARDLYGRISGLDGARHLSTMMCAAHRTAALERIRSGLKDGRSVRVISTSLIEAGVDIDFPVVMRAATGLDQIVQAAGRCNREGLRQTHESRVCVFEPDAAYQHKEMDQRWSATKSVLRRFARGELPGSLLDPPAIEAYFHELFWRKDPDEFDQYGVLKLLAAYAPGKGELKMPMESVARRFRMIDSALAPILIPFDETAETLIHDLRYAEHVGGIARKLQRYLVNIPPRDRAALIARGAAEVLQSKRFGDQFVVLLDRSLYRDDVGLDVSDPSFEDAGRLIL